MTHDELNVLGLNTAVVNFLIIVIFLLGLLVFDCLAFAVLDGMVVTLMASVGLFGGGELLCRGGLVLRVEVFDLGFTKDAVNGSDASVRVE